MQKNLAKIISPSSFQSCEKDLELVIKKIFVESKPDSDMIKRLLVINNPDCLTNLTNQAYIDAIKDLTPAALMEYGYLRVAPILEFGEHEDLKSYILITFDGFATCETNPQFRDCTVTFDIMCHTSTWKMPNYQLRPFKIMGYIDGILNNTKLSGIGTFQFLAANELILDNELAGYSLVYAAVHGSDDKIPPVEE